MKTLIKNFGVNKLNIKNARYVSIDSSSKSVAFAILNKSGVDVELVHVAKLIFPTGSSMRDKLELINSYIPALFQTYGPIDHVVIEQTIYIQSPQTSRILSYIVGHVWGKCLEYCDDVIDVPIMTWKSHIGYKNVSKQEKAQWDKEFGPAESKKIAARERKDRTGNIVRQKISNIDHLNDNDIMDAIAIGLWAVDNV